MTPDLHQDLTTAAMICAKETIVLSKRLVVFSVGFRLVRSFGITLYTSISFLVQWGRKLNYNVMGLELWCLTPLSRMFQLYRGRQFY